MYITGPISSTIAAGYADQVIRRQLSGHDPAYVFVGQW
jgi:hypothetical protein